MPAEPVKPVSQASRSSERRHIFVLVAVGAGQDEAGQPAPGEFGAQSLDPRPGLGRLRVVKRLKTRLEHHWRAISFWAI